MHTSKERPLRNLCVSVRRRCAFPVLCALCVRVCVSAPWAPGRLHALSDVACGETTHLQAKASGNIGSKSALNLTLPPPPPLPSPTPTPALPPPMHSGGRARGKLLLQPGNATKSTEVRVCLSGGEPTLLRWEFVCVCGGASGERGGAGGGRREGGCQRLQSEPGDR